MFRKVVSAQRIQEFDLKTHKWTIKSYGYQTLSKIIDAEPEEKVI